MPPGFQQERCCCSHRGQREGQKRKECEVASRQNLRSYQVFSSAVPLFVFQWRSTLPCCLQPRRKQAFILQPWPQSPSSSQSILLCCPLSLCQLLSAPQSDSQCTSSCEIEVTIQALTFSHSLFSPSNSFLTQ